MAAIQPHLTLTRPRLQNELVRTIGVSGYGCTLLVYSVPSPDVFGALMCLVPLNLPYKRMVRWVLEYWQSAGSQDLNQLKFVVPEGV